MNNFRCVVCMMLKFNGRDVKMGLCQNAESLSKCRVILNVVKNLNV